MQLPKLTPLQSRFVASFAACLILFVIYLTFSNPHFAYAAETGSIPHHGYDHTLDIQLGFEDKPQLGGGEAESDSKLLKYGVGAPGVEREIMGRAPTPAVRTLSNNAPGAGSIAPGETQYWVFPASSLSATRSLPTPALPPSQMLVDTSAEPGGNGPGPTRRELKKRQPGEIWLYTTLSVCDQPSTTKSNPEGPPNPLNMYISQNAANTFPGPNVNGPQTTHQADAGYVSFSDFTSGDTYYGIYAPQNPDFSGKYTYQLTSSIEEPYTYSYGFPGLYLMDSDRNSSLLVTGNLTKPNSSVSEWMNTGAPFDIFLLDEKDVTIKGLLNSYCGLNNTAQIRGRLRVETGMTTVAVGNATQQFYVTGLNKSTSYHAVLALKSKYSQFGPNNVGGGGMLWQSLSITTKSGLCSTFPEFVTSLTCTDDNCQVIYNLSFCDTVRYAVPGNPNNYPTMSSLASFYDNSTSLAFDNFNKSLEQIPCDTTSEAQWSLAANCSTCKEAYKKWLCAVTIPRCADYSSTEQYLQPRAINQSFINGTSPTTEFGDLTFSDGNKSVWYSVFSRVPGIDTFVQPGPYKEVLPCIRLCYGIVQNCPALLGFGCPLAGKGQDRSYGYVSNGGLSCNIPGAIWGINSAPAQGPSSTTLWVVVLATLGLTIMGI
ncbi:stretch-activated cation channel mid1 [Trapelia coarctata]|nr:stretch-activated cation channel mid1 [Trapelia coarctata]